MPKITCEFSSIDLANINIPKMLSQCKGVYDVTVSRRHPLVERNDFFYVPAENQFDGSSETAFGNTYSFLPALGIPIPHTDDSIHREPDEDASVVAEISCDAGCEDKVSGALVALGALKVRTLH